MNPRGVSVVAGMKQSLGVGVWSCWSLKVLDSCLLICQGQFRRGFLCVAEGWEPSDKWPCHVQRGR